MSTSIKAARNSRFQKGSGLFACRSCGKKTRATGSDGDGVLNCPICYDLAGEDNHLSDHSNFYSSPGQVQEQMNTLDAQSEGRAAALLPAIDAKLKALAGPRVKITESVDARNARLAKTPASAIKFNKNGYGGTIGDKTFTGPDRLGRFVIAGRYVSRELAAEFRAAYIKRSAPRGGAAVREVAQDAVAKVSAGRRKPAAKKLVMSLSTGAIRVG